MDTRDFCKVFDNEVQSELRKQLRDIEEKSIKEYNKKYMDKGQNPPPFETIIDGDCTTTVYPNGRMEFNFRHRWKPINPAYKDQEKPLPENT